MVSIVADGRFGTAGDGDSEPSVGASARLPSGGFVTVFAASDGPVVAQLYDSAGQSVGGLIQVSRFGAQPDVAVLPSGGWAIVWRTPAYDQIQSAVFDAAGNRVAPIASVSAPASSPFESLGNPHVAAGAGDTFTVSWTLANPGGLGSLYVRVVDGGNTPLAPATEVKSGKILNGDVLTTSDGRQLVITTAQTEGDSTSQIKVALFDGSTNRVTNANFISIASTSSNIVGRNLTQLTGGQLLVSWTEYLGGSTYVARGELFSDSGVSLGQGFTRTGVANVAALDDGGFVVTTGLVGETPFAQVFDAQSRPLGDAFPVIDPAGRFPLTTVIAPFGTDDFGVYVSYQNTSTNILDTSLRIFRSVINGTDVADVLDGTDGADIIRGLGGDDRLSGLSGDDLLVGGSGADRLDGGPGSDTVTYDDSGAAVLVDLTAGTASGGTASGDELISIENLIGSSFDDVLIGNGISNRLEGRDGNDRLSGLAGADVLIGGSGVDLADYSASSAGVTISLVGQQGVGGDAEGDILLEIEDVRGSAFDDVLGGSTAMNRLEGMAGNDLLLGSINADILDGGTGRDEASYADSINGVIVDLAAGTARGGDAQGDTLISIEDLTGSKQDDLLTGNTEANRLFGLAGSDTIRGGAGNDFIDGGSGADMLFGDDGDDEIQGGSGADQINGGAGNDLIFGGDGDDFAAGLDGNDILDGGAGNDALFGNAGSDTIFGGAGNDYLDGQEDGDFILGGAGDDQLFGGAGVDLLGGEGGNDTIRGGADGDNIYGGAGNDVLFGEDGDDFIDGQEDGDFILGGDGNDRLFGGDGVDLLGGEAGNDELHGGLGNDNLYGGVGTDSIFGEEGDDVIDGQEDGDFLLGGAGNDRIMGSGGVDLLGGEDGDDLLFGGADGDNMYGGNGNDALFGEDGNDFLSGGSGNDILGGNGGSDRIEGGAGADTFLYFSTLDSSTIGGGADIISDFLSGTDKIDLSAIDADTTLAGDQAFNFVGFSDQAGPAGTLRLGFIQDVGIFLFGNVNNDPAADFILNIGTFNVQTSDFIL